MSSTNSTTIYGVTRNPSPSRPMPRPVMMNPTLSSRPMMMTHATTASLSSPHRPTTSSMMMSHPSPPHVASPTTTTATTTTASTNTSAMKKRRRVGSLPAYEVTPHAAYEHLMPKKLVEWEPAAVTLHQLMEFEKRIDAFLSRKICDYQELTRQPMKVTRTLRLYLYHYAVNEHFSESMISSHQVPPPPSQPPQSHPSPPLSSSSFSLTSSSSSFHLGEIGGTSTSSIGHYSLPPSFTFHIEGRWLANDRHPSDSSAITTTNKKFSELLRSLRIELRRQSSTPSIDEQQQQQHSREIVEPEIATTETEWIEWIKGGEQQQQQQQQQRVSTTSTMSVDGSSGSTVAGQTESIRNRVDGFEVKRQCLSNRDVIDVKILLQLDLSPDRFRLSDVLASLLGISVETRMGVAMALWNYVREHQLQTVMNDDEMRTTMMMSTTTPASSLGSTMNVPSSHTGMNRIAGSGGSHTAANDVSGKRREKMFISDEPLRQVFGVDRWSLSQLPALLDSHLLPLEPITLNYQIRMQEPSTPDHPQMIIYDMEVEVDDPLRDRMQRFITALPTLSATTVATPTPSVTTSTTQSSATSPTTTHRGPSSDTKTMTTPSSSTPASLLKDLSEWDVKFVELLYDVRQSCVKREFMKSFATRPVEFINQWVASQAHDLKTILGEGDAMSELTLHMEDWRTNSRLFQDEWVQEAIAYYLQSKSHQTLQQWMSMQQQKPSTTISSSMIPPSSSSF